MLQIKLRSSGDFFRADNFASGSSRLLEKIFPQKILQRQTKEVAEQVAESIRQNLYKGRKYTGGKVAPLKRSTIKRKGHSRVFLDTGKLFNEVIVKKIGTSFVVQIKDDRSAIAEYLQEGVSGRMKARPFFGITRANLRKIIAEVFANRKLQSRSGAA